MLGIEHQAKAPGIERHPEHGGHGLQIDAACRPEPYHDPEDGALLRHAAHANAMARKLAAAMPFRVRHPVEANTVFVEMDEPTLARLHAAGWFVYRFLDGSVRFVCSWATTAAAVEELAEALQQVA